MPWVSCLFKTDMNSWSWIASDDKWGKKRWYLPNIIRFWEYLIRILLQQISLLLESCQICKVGRYIHCCQENMRKIISILAIKYGKVHGIYSSFQTRKKFIHMIWNGLVVDVCSWHHMITSDEQVKSFGYSH